MLWNFYFKPDVSVRLTGENDTSVSYELRNDGWSAATNVRLEIDAFSKIGALTSRPDLGIEKREASSGNQLINYPRLDSGQVVFINIAVSAHSDLSKEFGAAGFLYARYDEGPVQIIYPDQK